VVSLNIFYSALGIVLGSLYFALTGDGVLVSAIFCLVISTLAFTTLRKFHIQIFSLLSFFLLMYLSFNIRQEYFEYFAKNKIKSQGQIFRVIETKEAAFFSETIYLRPIAKNFLEDYLNPTLLWKTRNFKALQENDLISFPDKLEMQSIDKNKREFYRKNKLFYQLKNKNFKIEGQNQTQINKIQKTIKRYYKEHLKPINAEIALGLVLGGNHASIDHQLMANIRNLGLAHFFSASGFHLVILLLIVMWISDRIPLIKRIQTPLAISMMLLYMATINFCPPIVRAGFMAITFLLFKNSNRKVNGFNLLIILAAIVLIIDPHTAFDIGFQLSYLATMGIIVWCSDINSKLEKTIKIKWLREILSVTLSSQILLFPLIIYYFSNLQLWSLLSNLVFTPILSLVTILSFGGVYFLIDPILDLLVYVFNLSQNLPFINTKLELDFTSLVLFWIFNISVATFLLKDLELETENYALMILRSKLIQKTLAASAFLMLIGSNLQPYNVYQLKIKDAKILNQEYKDEFNNQSDYHYFEIQGHKALIINNLKSIEQIKSDIREVNYLFIPNLNAKFIYLNRLVETLNPQITVIATKSQSKKVKENLELIGTKSNIIFGDGHIFLSRGKFWKITN
jgi:ComEC/Rec2-related protein